MKLSVVVVVYNMQREAPRTLASLAASYQQELSADDYEVIVVENGSPRPLDPEAVRALGSNFHYHFLRDASPSPARAINFGLRQSRGEVVGVMIDGARICSPGLLANALRAGRLYERALVATLGFYLGPEYQRFAVMKGYDRAVEDRLLTAIDWPTDGYRLFEIAALDESSHTYQAIAESNALFLRRELWDELGGADERFDAPGGGLLNLDTFYRACELPSSELVILLGEGTFHQLHGGIATNASPEIFEPRLEAWKAQYLALRGRAYDVHPKVRRYFGTYRGPQMRTMAAELNEIFFPAYQREAVEMWRQLEAHRSEAERMAAQLGAAHAERTQVTEERAVAQTERDRLRLQLEIIHGSHSWLLTRPLRAAFRRWRVLKQRLPR